ncbi:hypothetical protein DRE_02311 [Drechslerella stenobrocha 248]|uniref:XPG N-terminal domain-containing protein n=1 Tax=Drechslerella stenobrocha 248 TaxID=1043628 RepID=W7I7X9_9PEZI|nr:hypothetical protein DRE_02311 [Drechslerella stenobrocha 248]
MPAAGTRTVTPLSIGGSIRNFDAWSTNRLQTLPISVLKDTVVGIDAGSYLKKIIDGPGTKEPLVPALGGFPFSLKSKIEDDLSQWQQAGITPLFVFSGIQPLRTDKASSMSETTAKNRATAWALYDGGHAAEAVEAFGDSGILQPQEIYRFLRKILIDNDVSFQVAPYASWAQLVYLEKHPKQFVDAIFGPAEVFFYDIEKVITGFNFSRASFSCLNKKAIMQDLGGLNHEQFIDACILSGFDFCNTFPIIDKQPANLFKTCLDFLKTWRSATGIVNQYSESPTIRDSGYLDKYRRAKLAIKHQPILTDDGKIEPFNLDEAPGDMHEFVGNRLPEEVYFYLSRGVIGSQVLDMLVTGELQELPPLDSGENETYKVFLESIQTLRAQCLCLLAQPLQHWWNNKKITITYWYDKVNPKPVAFKDLNPTLYEATSTWNAKEALFGPALASSPNKSLLAFSITYLGDKSLAIKTTTLKSTDNLLKSTNEVILNTLWRTMQIRGFIGPDHQLTPWGKVLNTALSSLDPADELEEACYLGIELLKAKLLRADPSTLSQYSGRDTDKRYCSLISRVASLGKLRHNSIGYTGPLSRTLLTFNSIIRLMSKNLENLTQMVLTSLLMNGDADRDDRKDWNQLGLEIPFAEDINAGLGIAVKTYLDELTNTDDPTSVETRLRVQNEELIPQMFVQSVDVMADVSMAFRLWDAIMAGVRTAPDNLIVDTVKFTEADAWLSQRRPITLTE